MTFFYPRSPAEEVIQQRERSASLLDKDGTGFSIYNNDNCDHCY